MSIIKNWFNQLTIVETSIISCGMIISGLCISLYLIGCNMIYEELKNTFFFSNLQLNDVRFYVLLLLIFVGLGIFFLYNKLKDIFN